MPGGGDPLVGLAANGLGLRRHHLVGFAGVDEGGRLVGAEPGGVGVCQHVGGVVLDRLEAADGPAELDPVLGVLDGVFQGGLGPAGHLGAHRDGAQGHDLPHRRPGLVQRAHQVLTRDQHLVEDDLALLVVGDGDQRRAGDSVAAGVDEKEGQAVAGVVVVVAGAGYHQVVVGGGGVLDEHLGAVEHPALAARHAPHLDAPRVVGAAGLGEAQAEPQVAAEDPWQVVPFLGLAAELQQRQSRLEHAGLIGARAWAAAELLHQHHQVHETLAPAAVGLRKDQPQPASAGHLLPHLGRVPQLALLQLAHDGPVALLRQERSDVLA